MAGRPTKLKKLTFRQFTDAATAIFSDASDPCAKCSMVPFAVDEINRLCGWMQRWRQLEQLATDADDRRTVMTVLRIEIDAALKGMPSEDMPPLPLPH